MNKFIARIICLFLGHRTYRYSWKNVYHISFNRKGGKRRGAGVKIYKTKHHRVYCERCGKLIKKK